MRYWAFWLPITSLLAIAPQRELTAQACVGGSPLGAWDASVGIDLSKTDVTRRFDIEASFRPPFVPLVLQASAGRMAYRNESSSSGSRSFAAMVPVTLVPALGVQVCARAETGSTSLIRANLRVREFSAAAGVGRLVSVGGVLDLGVWGRLSLVRSRLRYDLQSPGFPPLAPPVEERFTGGAVGLSLTAFRRATARLYYESPLGDYTKPADATLSETIASDPRVGIGVVVTIPRP